MKGIAFGIVFLLTIVAAAVSAFAADPTLTLIDEKVVNEGELLAFTIISSAADSASAETPVTFKMCKALSIADTACTLSVPNAAGFSEITVGTTTANITNATKTTAQFNWTPDFTQAGAYFIRVSANDGDSSDAKNFKITVNDVPPLLTVTNLKLGDSKTERSNPRATDEKDRNKNLTGTVTLTNKGGETIKNIKFSKITGTGKYANAFANQNSFGVTLPATVAELLPGASVDATVTLRVPENLDAVDSTLKAAAFNVAQLIFTATKADGTAIAPITSAVTMQARNNLQIKTSTIQFNGKSEKLSNGKTVDTIKPGMSITVELEVENKFKDDDEVSIEDIEITALSTGDDKDLDVDENENIDDLGPEDTETIQLEFTVEDDARKGREPLEITLEGIDENGAIYGEKWEVDLDIEREDHEISVQSTSLSSETISCQEATELTVQIKNTGRNKEDDVFLRVFSPEIANYQSNLEIGTLDENDENTQRFAIPVPESLVPGSYRVTIETYYDVGKKSDTDAEIIKKEACVKPQEPAKPQEPSVPDVVVVPTPPTTVTQPTTPTTTTTQQPPITGAVTATPEKESFLDSSAFMALLILGYVVVLGGGALALIKLLRK
ncbi:hypothetical protein HYU12_02975 [Candidatus Woesearchaeota archaeon]|nr:hypothetical protein [Candidatus Woesearchaeota archaeon]